MVRSGAGHVGKLFAGVEAFGKKVGAGVSFWNWE